MAKTVKIKEYHDKSVADLTKLLAEKRKGIQDFYFGVAGSKARDVKVVSKLRKDVARIMTSLTMRANNEKNKA